MRHPSLLVPFVLLVLGAALAPAQSADALLAEGEQLQGDGNHAEAYAAFRTLVLEHDAATGAEVAPALRHAVRALGRLNRTHEVDALLENAVTRHGDDFAVLTTVAGLYRSAQHWGFLIAGEFRRGHHRGGGEQVSAEERDRVRALQLLRRAMPLAPAAAAGSFWLQVADTLVQGRPRWRLQALTDLDTLPDYAPMRYGRGGSQGAPVDAEGDPVLFAVPADWATATSDGERWRWCLMQAAEAGQRGQALQRRADAALAAFGVQTLAHGGGDLPVDATDGDGELGPWAVHTLAEDEVLARLANGARRFRLGPEHHPIARYRALAEIDGFQRRATRALAQIFENRRQYPRAAEHWGRAGNAEAVAQITGKWGRFARTTTHPAGTAVTLDYVFRNGTTLKLQAWRVDVDGLLAHVRDTLREHRDGKLDWQELEVEHLGRRLVTRGDRRFLGDRVARWDQKLEPRDDHFDRRVRIDTPLTEAGAYLVEATLLGGNTSRMVVWVADTALVRKNVDGQAWFYCADARTGAPVADAEVHLFGFDVDRHDRRFRVDSQEHRLRTGADGIARLDGRQLADGHRWLVTARTAGGRLAFLGFDRYWLPRHSDADRLDRVRGYLITDRPVYRPGDTVHLSGWLRRARYDLADGAGGIAEQEVTVTLRDGRGDTVLERQATTDPYGGIQLSWTVGDDATLGSYRWRIAGYDAQRTFRVEEYKKPEFEVTVRAPEAPVTLGERFTATIAADYLFGAPVTEAEVHYTVTRRERRTHWYPGMPWDWLYDRGYWWTQAEYPWYPGWRDWGCLPPRPPWNPWQQPPAEVVAEGTVAIGADGTVAVPIDTGLAAATMGDRDHEYRIQAEVTDASRRSIVGSGTVIAARAPFRVTVWTDGGWHRPGAVLTAHAAATGADGEPVAATGTLRLLRIGYDDARTPREEEVARVDVRTDADGRLQHTFRVVAAGQYRVAAALRPVAADDDEETETVTGGALVHVPGAPGAADADDYRFNALELIADSATYAPGDTARVLVAVDRTDAQVLLFQRPEHGRYRAPTVLALDGRTRVVEIPIARSDMPNIFLEAVVVADGAVHSVVEELIVPPADRLLDVTVSPSAAEVGPGDEVELAIRVRDEHGAPVVGPTALTVYDRGLEYVAGGSNMDDIRAFFWSWRRAHQPRTTHSLARWGYEVYRRHQSRMRSLGVFGQLQAPDDEAAFARFSGGRAGRGTTGAMVARSQAAPMAAEAVAADAEAAPGGGAGEAEEAAAPVTTRTDFADSAFWDGRIVTDAEGRATVTVPMPEDLTTWTVRAWSLGPGTRVGATTTEVVTSKHVLVRMQAPRFFVERDTVVLSANVHNEFAAPIEAEVSLSVNDVLRLDGEATRTVAIPAHGAVRVDWRTTVQRSGEAVIGMRALSERESDALERRFPVVRYGAERVQSRSLALRGARAADTMRFTVPAQRDPAASELLVQVSPSLAASLVESLPYLVSYPHGCTEQTLNRFLPTVLVHRLLDDLDVDLAAVRDAERLDSTTIADGGHEDWRRWRHQPVFDRDEVADMVRHGVERLAEMQLSDGGWGWFSGWGERSAPHTTAVVVRGLRRARAAGAAVEDGIIRQGEAWLRAYQQRQITRLDNAATDTEPYKRHADDLDALVFTVLAAGDHVDADMQAYLYRDRTRLAAYSLAMLALTSHRIGADAHSAMYRRNVEQFLVEDPDNQTAWLDLAAPWWHWYGSDNEAMAWYLKLLAAQDPDFDRAAAIAKYLLGNRRHAGRWNSTRDTALCIEALAEFAQASGELAFDGTIEILVDDTVVEEVAVTPATLFQIDGRYRLTGDALTAGEHRVRIRRRGDGAVYANAWLSVFDRQDTIPAAGGDLRVTRQVYRLVRDDDTGTVAGADGQVVTQREQRYRRTPLADGDAVRSGDLLEVELTIDAKNDYEYLIFEDHKPAGCEPVDQRSGYYRDGLRAYRELRDDRVSLYVDRLMRGRHSIAYRVRAEIPGRFHALPAQARAMYAPELRGNSASRTLVIEDR